MERTGILFMKSDITPVSVYVCVPVLLGLTGVKFCHYLSKDLIYGKGVSTNRQQVKLIKAVFRCLSLTVTHGNLLYCIFPTLIITHSLTQVGK